jgi:hypothetical protein
MSDHERLGIADWVSIAVDGKMVCLDGDFSFEELEIVIAEMKRRQDHMIMLLERFKEGK